MKMTSIAIVLLVVVLFVHLIPAAESARSTRVERSVPSAITVGDIAEGVAIGDRYLISHLPASVAARLPSAEARGDQYLSERIALAELVIGERILAAEDLANAYARELPGFAAVLLADGFRQDANGTWFYDRYESWMRFPLNR